MTSWRCGRRAGTCRTGSTASARAIGPSPTWRSAIVRSPSAIWPTLFVPSAGRSAGMRPREAVRRRRSGQQLSRSPAPTRIRTANDVTAPDASSSRAEDDPTGKRRRMKDGRVFLAIFVLTLATRLANLAYLGRDAAVEEHLHENWLIAHNLVTGNGYLLSGTSPTAHKPPVSPLFLAPDDPGVWRSAVSRDPDCSIVHFCGGHNRRVCRVPIPCKRPRGVAGDGVDGDQPLLAKGVVVD